MWCVTFVGSCSALFLALALFGTRHFIGAVDKDGSEKVAETDQRSEKKHNPFGCRILFELGRPWKVMRRRKEASLRLTKSIHLEDELGWGKHFLWLGKFAGQLCRGCFLD